MAVSVICTRSPFPYLEHLITLLLPTFTLNFLLSHTLSNSFTSLHNFSSQSATSKEKKVKSSMGRSLPVENLPPQNVASIMNYCSNLPKYPNGELLIAVNHNELWTMVSETVDPIDWSHVHHHEQYPDCLVHSINRSSLRSTGNRYCNFSMRGNILANAAT